VRTELDDCLARYEDLRRHRQHDGPRLAALRLYEIETWNDFGPRMTRQSRSGPTAGRLHRPRCGADRPHGPEVETSSGFAPTPGPPLSAPVGFAVLGALFLWQRDHDFSDWVRILAGVMVTAWLFDRRQDSSCCRSGEGFAECQARWKGVACRERDRSVHASRWSVASEIGAY